MDKLPKAIICDLDGTLCHKGDRPFNDYMRVGEDTLCTQVKTIINALVDNRTIILVSGRENTGYCRSITEAWLVVHNVRYHYFYQRQFKDFRSDEIVKREIYENFIKPKYEVDFVLDDRNKVVKMWRDLGLICLQVQEGDF